MEFNEAVPYVVAAYMGIWVVLLGYVLSVNGKLSKINKELGVLGKTLEKKGNK